MPCLCRDPTTWADVVSYLSILIGPLQYLSCIHNAFQEHSYVLSRTHNVNCLEIAAVASFSLFLGPSRLGKICSRFLERALTSANSPVLSACSCKNVTILSLLIARAILEISGCCRQAKSPRLKSPLVQIPSTRSRVKACGIHIHGRACISEPVQRASASNPIQSLQGPGRAGDVNKCISMSCRACRAQHLARRAPNWPKPSGKPIQVATQNMDGGNMQEHHLIGSAALQLQVSGPFDVQH